LVKKHLDETMMEVINFTNKGKIREQASEWIMRLEDPDISEESIQSLLEWLETSPQHRTELRELANVWGSMDSLSILSEMIPLDDPLYKHQEKREKFRLRWNTGFAAALGMVCLMTVVGIFVMNEGLQTDIPAAPPAEVAYETPVGAQETINLSDGSFIILNTNSSVIVDYTSDTRNIRLEHGEAYFEVAHNPDRPFIVHVGNGFVKAVGTAFNVHYDDKTIGVTVTDGVVEVGTSLAEDVTEALSPTQSQTRKKASKVLVTAGQTVEFDEVIRTVDTVGPQVIDHKLAWQRGMLIFDGESLEEAVNEITRYTDTEIVIDDTIRNVKIGGYFRTGELDAMLNAFESSFGIVVNVVNDDLILLSRRSD
jgi:transmembrane sensor